MKRILILSHALELGGAERALLGLLEHLDYERYQVDLFLLRHEGELLPYLDPRANLLPQDPDYSCLAVPIGNVLKRGKFLIAWGRLCGKLLAKRYVKKHRLPSENHVELEYSHKYTKRFLPDIMPDTEYDLAISFLTPHYFVAEKVRAKRKIAWIHTDYSIVKVHTESELAMWSRYDRIISISEQVSETFLSVYPTLRDKLTVIENMLPEALIRKQAEAFAVQEECKRESGEWMLLSVGRFCYQKNFDSVPSICKALLESGLRVKWYLIGFGGDEELIRRRIAEAGVQENVILLGRKQNPYPYIKACDVYVQPSRYEGKSVAVREAQLLCKPVVITHYATADSQLEDGVDGVIVPQDNAGCAAGLANVLRDREVQRRLPENCARRDFTDAGEVFKLYRLMEP